MLEDSAEMQPSGAIVEIAHILFMDIVAYSILPMDEQRHVLGKLQELVATNHEVVRAQAANQLIRLPTGDGMALVFFTDPETPVHCAMHVAAELRRSLEIKLRIGIHTGPVYRMADINANLNVSGGGINMAQRVMDCGDAGHILVSASLAEVLRQVSATWSTSLHDLREAEVKHGVRVHIYNLYTEDIGNPEVPQKLSTRQRADESVISTRKRKKISVALTAVGALTAVAIGGFLYSRRAHALTDKDTVVLADITNKTGDAVFDDTIKQGLSVALSQSPFLNLLPNQRVTDTLKLMGKSAGEPLTPELARQVCIRTGSKAMLTGSIATLGSQYVIGIQGIHCSDGDVLAQEQVEAPAKEDVLKVLDRAATNLRSKLGESLSTVQKFDTPLEQATTPSLEALQAFSLGAKATDEQSDAAAIPFYRRAIKLDPSFAFAYSLLGLSFSNLGEGALAAENFQKAYELREHASERERYMISAQYYAFGTGEIEKARQIYAEWLQVYPRDVLPLAPVIHSALGEYDKAVGESLEGIHRYPYSSQFYVNLMAAYLALDRVQDAKSIFDQAAAHRLDDPSLHSYRYVAGFLDGNAADMEQQLAWAVAKPQAEDLLLSLKSDTYAYIGQFSKARELTGRAADTAQRNEQKETAALWLLNGALRDAEVGNGAQADQRVTAALALVSSRDVQILAALALARAGDTGRAQKMADELKSRFPSHTMLNTYWLPAIRAAVALARGRSNTAVEVLGSASPRELGEPAPYAQAGGTLYPRYLRGQAFLKAGRGEDADVEFQSIIDHRGIVANFILGALSHLQQGRARAITGNKEGARKAYQDFLTLWKDADPDVPILKQAKAEYSKLQ